MNDRVGAPPAITPEIVAEHGLTAEEYRRVLNILGRAPNLTELGIFSVMWSEHCSYKSSRRWLKRLPTTGAVRHPGAGRERRRDRHRRRAGLRLQDREPQPPELHRALSGGRDRRGRHHARRLHHGRAADRQPECAALRRARGSQDPASPGRRRRRHRGLRQLHGRADRGRRDQFPPRLQRQHPGQRHDRGAGRQGSDLLCEGGRRRQSGDLCRRQDRARRHPWRHHGLGRVPRRFRGKAAHGPGGRPLHREAAAGSLPGADGDRRHRRDPGHGCRRPHLLLGRDELQGRARHRARSRPGADARDRHDALRDHALGKPGADADGDPARGPRARQGHLRQMGA